MNALLSVENVFAGYDKADVLQDVTLGIAPGSITCILGSNGAGKSTMLKLLEAEVIPVTGT